MLKKLLKGLNMAKKETKKPAKAAKPAAPAKKAAPAKAPAKKAAPAPAAKKPAKAKLAPLPKAAAPKGKLAPAARPTPTKGKTAPAPKAATPAAKSAKPAAAPKPVAKEVKEVKEVAAKAPKKAAEKEKPLSKEEQKKLAKAPKKGAEKEDKKLKGKGSEKEHDGDFESDDFDDLDMGGDGDFDLDEELGGKFIDIDDVAPAKKKGKKVIEEEIRDHLAEEILSLSEDYQVEDVLGAIRSMDFFKADNLDCMERGCDNPATTAGHCRFHYIKNWKDIKKKQVILEDGRLQKLIEELIGKYPFKYIEAILNDLSDEKSFGVVLKELNIDTMGDDALDEVSDEDMDDEDIAFETKVTTAKVAFDDTE